MNRSDSSFRRPSARKPDVDVDGTYSPSSPVAVDDQSRRQAFSMLCLRV